MSATAQRLPQPRPARVDWPRVLTDTCRAIEAQPEEPRLAALAARAGVSGSELQRQFTRRLGTSPKGYARALRLQRLARRGAGRDSALGAALDAGFGSSTTAYRETAAALGVAPGRLRGPLALGWWAGLTSLGWMLVAASPRGICWIDFATGPEAALRALRAAFPRATLQPDEARLAEWFDRVRALILLPAEARDLPLDVQGTAFQCRVWRALRRIPLGTTISYGELARRIGAPRAVRAVAQACGGNPLPVVIPCHRVIGADGSLTGYTGGLDRKEALLEREGATGWWRRT